MAVAQEKRTYPYIPTKNWWDLRRRFMNRPPSKIDAEYLQALLGVENERSAGNIIGPLKTVGLIDDDGKPTDIAFDWASNEHYKDACQRILDNVYGVELQETFPEPELDKQAIANWFKRRTRKGTSVTNRMAMFYILIRQGDPTVQEQAPVGPSSRAPRTKRAQPSPIALSSAAPQPPVESVLTPTTVHEVRNESMQSQPLPMPAVHIDLQIHISAEASAEQIDRVFASMAKHLYGRSAE
ncbi:MAG: DUF5343 domain-containing protein [Chloroflexi bacterium]|nr:DUF5343 domain-containing protein [Chloroflexota bacterium]